MVCDCADECVFEIISPALPFAIADFYLSRRALTDEDIGDNGLQLMDARQCVDLSHCVTHHL